MNGVALTPQEPPSALQQRSSRLTFSERSLSPAAGRIHGFRSGSSPSPGPSSRSRSLSTQRATSRSRLIRSYPASSRADSTSPGNGDRSSSRFRKAKNDWKVNQDFRERLPPVLSRFLGWRPPGEAPPHKALPFPPFSWLRHIPLKYEVWLLSTIGAFVGIALIEVIISAAFPNDGTILIVASFGASAVLAFATIESPLAQPRHLIGGQIVSVILAICLTKLFRLSPNYKLSDTIVPGELNHIVWINGALAMALSLLAQQITGTVHPPGGATAIIASVQPAAINMSWRLIYVVLISSLIMMAWACIINNVGRRRYPTYWFSGTHKVVRQPDGKVKPKTQDEEEMAAEEGRNAFFASLADVPEDDIAERVAGMAIEGDAAEQEKRGRTGVRTPRTRSFHHGTQE